MEQSFEKNPSQEDEKAYLALAEETKKLLPSIQADGEKRYLERSSGLLRLIKNEMTGKIVVCGHNNSELLLPIANRLAKELDLEVADY